MISPITGSKNCQLIRKETVASLVNGYKNRLDIDVSGIFKHVDSIPLYQCNDTSLKFYYFEQPLDNEAFYAQLSQFDWYYTEERWEFGETAKLIEPNMKVLEIGCGKGNFIKQVLQKTSHVLGLELNPHAVELAQAEGLPVQKLLVQEVGSEHDNSFDLICTFQVVEHLMDLQDFLNHTMRLLKPGGILVIAVPNNQSPIFSEKPIKVYEQQRFLFDLMNKPPHHFLKWDKGALAQLCNFFPLSVVDISFEQMPKWLLDFTVEVWYFKWKKIIPKRFIYPYIRKKYHELPGHSVMAVYKKQ